MPGFFSWEETDYSLEFKVKYGREKEFKDKILYLPASEWKSYW